MVAKWHLELLLYAAAAHIPTQAGRPKTITGFQTHTTPVLMGVGERAELGTEKYIALSPVLEGQV